MIENKKSKKKEPNYKDGDQPIPMRKFNKLLDRACNKKSKNKMEYFSE